MATIVERMRSFLGIETKAAQTAAPYAKAVGPFRIVQGGLRSAAGAKMLRQFADNCEPVRTAINWRKQQVAQARHRIVRIDDPRRPPDPRVVDAANRLFQFINPKRESFRSLMDMEIEDLLVLDAGCIEKEKCVGPSKDTGSKIAALWAVDGSTIEPDPNWDGSDPKAIRYRQYLDGKLHTELRNDQLVYMMQTPTTHRLRGMSQVETLVAVIESSLFGERYARELLRNAAPPGMLYLGTGLSDQQVDSFRERYKSEVLGSGEMMVGGGGTGSPDFIKFGWSPRDLLFDEYRQWLINIIAFVFQIDKTIFGMVDDVNRSTSKTMSARTDQGFVALARLVAEYITREIISEIDPNHGFEFLDLVVTDPLIQAKIDQVYSTIGALTPNEIRAERFGLDPVPWGDAPYNATGSATPDPLSEDEPAADNGEGPSADEKSLDPLDAALAKATTARLRYEASPTVSNAEAWEAADREFEEVAKRSRPFDATARTTATRRRQRTARTPNASSGYLNS